MPTLKLTTEIVNAAILGMEAQREKLDAKIAELRGWLTGGSAEPAAAAEPAKRKRRRMSAAGRKAIAEAQRKRWAEEASEEVRRQKNCRQKNCRQEGTSEEEDVTGTEGCTGGESGESTSGQGSRAGGTSVISAPWTPVEPAASCCSTLLVWRRFDAGEQRYSVEADVWRRLGSVRSELTGTPAQGSLIDSRNRPLPVIAFPFRVFVGLVGQMNPQAPTLDSEVQVEILSTSFQPHPPMIVR